MKGRQSPNPLPGDFLRKGARTKKLRDFRQHSHAPCPPPRRMLSKRERVIMLQPWDSGLPGMTLRYPYELREAKDYFYDIPDMTDLLISMNLR